MAKFNDVFSEAGFTHTPLSKIENGYYPWEYCMPWWKAHTIYGDITIGWRKRVISIEWSGINHPVGRELFKGEDVTKDDSLVHAWSWEYASKYLKMLKESLDNA